MTSASSSRRSRPRPRADTRCGLPDWARLHSCCCCTLLFSATPFLLIPAFLLLVVGAIVWFAGREKTEPAPDPVTGGPRWWQKRWDE